MALRRAGVPSSISDDQLELVCESVSLWRRDIVDVVASLAQSFQGRLYMGGPCPTGDVKGEPWTGAIWKQVAQTDGAPPLVLAMSSDKSPRPLPRGSDVSRRGALRLCARVATPAGATAGGGATARYLLAPRRTNAPGHQRLFFLTRWLTTCPCALSFAAAGSVWCSC